MSILSQLFCSPPPVDKYGVIYVATQRESGKQYVGQTVKSISDRWSGHCTPNKKNGQVVTKAIAKYGRDAFDINMLDWASSKEELDYKEKFWITFLDTQVPSGYNLKEGGANGKPHPDSVAKMAATKCGQKLPDGHPFKQKGIKPWQVGRKMSSENIEKNRERALARYASGWIHPMTGKKHTKEARAKIKLTSQGPRPNRRKPLQCVETGQIFQGVTWAEKWLIEIGVVKTSPRSTLCLARDCPNKTAGGYHWKSIIERSPLIT